MDVVARISQLMEERGWTQYRLRIVSGLPQSTVDNIFRKDTIPSIPTLESICAAFGVSLSEFFAEGAMFSLTEEQSNLLKQWARLTPEQKQALLNLMSAIS